MTLNPEKRLNRPRPLSDLLPGLTKDIFGRKNMLFGKMAAEWSQVAGAEIAAQTTPLDLKFARKKDNKDNQAVLHLAVAPAYALELSYQKILLIERLNVFFGYPAIKDIKFVQRDGVMVKKERPRPFSRPITRQEEQEIEESVAHVQENDLQTALKSLGKSIISRTKKKD